MESSTSPYGYYGSVVIAQSIKLLVPISDYWFPDDRGITCYHNTANDSCSSYDMRAPLLIIIQFILIPSSEGTKTTSF